MCRIVQNSNFSDQILSINVTDVSFCEKVVLSLVFREFKTKMASKMATIKKKLNFQPNFILFHVFNIISSVEEQYATNEHN